MSRTNVFCDDTIRRPTAAGVAVAIEGGLNVGQVRSGEVEDDVHGVAVTASNHNIRNVVYFGN